VGVGEEGRCNNASGVRPYPTMQAAPPSSQEHTTQLPSPVCLSNDMAPEKRKVPQSLPARAAPRPFWLLLGGGNSGSVARSPTDL
jgi:hypothetical protein